MSHPRSPHLAAWPARPTPTYSSTLVDDYMLEETEEQEARHLPTLRDAHRIAVHRGVEVWHTEKLATHDCPNWPPGRLRADRDPRKFDYVYRGFDFDELETVLTQGLDYPGPAAFFGSESRGKAWEYPAARDTVAVMVFNGDLVERSWADVGGKIGPAGYARTYTDDGRTLHTHFPPGRGSGRHYEEAYGFFIPGDPCEALVGVIIGSDEADCGQILPQMPDLVLEPVPADSRSWDPAGTRTL